MTAIIHLQGHLGKDVTIHSVKGKPVVNFILATNERLKDGEKTTWWRLSYWNTISDKLKACLKKGSPLQVVASLKTPTIYTDQQGSNRVQLDGNVLHFGFPPFGNKKNEEKTSSPQTEKVPGSEPFAEDDYLPF